ncbi:unnamed protein product, partial [Mesorhabditis belari]|uniref:Uncharacterized protein n=1 Tax=Mesorhabditis belari TaxID=2138241 RepID=A0AAF3EDU5_9BILA
MNNDVFLEVRNDLCFEPRGIYGMAANQQGKLAVIKKVDKQTTTDPRAPAPDADAVIEQYNVLGQGAALLEMVHSPANGSIECVAWVGEYLIAGHISGSVSIIHPHATEIKTAQLCPCPLWAVCAIDSTKCVFTSHSAQVIIYDVQQNETVFRRNLGIDQRLFSVAALKNLIAVGATGAVFILDEMGQTLFELQVERADRQLPTIVWSVALVETKSGISAITGDSRGTLSFFDAKSGALQKTIHSHQADILIVRQAFSKNLKNAQIMAAGVDPRIVVVENKTGSNWETVSMITGAQSDLRALAFYNERLFAGGADSSLYEVPKFYERRRMVLQDLPIDYSTSILTGGRFSVVRGSNHLDMWTSGVTTEQEDADGALQLKQQPKLLARIYTQGTQIVTACALSENGKILCVSTCESTSAYELKLSKMVPVRRLPFRGVPSTAIGILDKKILLCHDNFGIRQYALKGGDQEEEGKQIIEQYGCAAVSRIATLANFSKVAVLTTRAQIFVIDLNKGTSNLLPKMENCVPTSLVLSSPNILTVLSTGIDSSNAKVISQYSLDAAPKFTQLFNFSALYPSPGVKPILTSLSSSGGSHVSLIDTNGTLIVLNEKSVPLTTSWKQAIEHEETLGWAIGWRKVKDSKEKDEHSVLSVISIPRPAPTQAPFKLKKFGQN